jgi:hypothetical protein
MDTWGGKWGSTVQEAQVMRVIGSCLSRYKLSAGCRKACCRKGSRTAPIAQKSLTVMEWVIACRRQEVEKGMLAQQVMSGGMGGKSI